MKKGLTLLLALALLLTASGCVEKEYYYESPVSGGPDASFEDSVDIRNYSMLITALTNLILHHAEHGQVRFVDYPGSPGGDLSAASMEIKSKNPLGAYAVDSIRFNVTYVVSYYVADLTISYLRSVEELQSIVYAAGQEEFCETLLAAVDDFSPHLVMRLYSSGVDEDYILRLVKEDYLADPIPAVTEPEVTVKSYPSEGANRLYDITFSYGVTRTQANMMAAETRDRLAGAAEKLQDAEPAARALSAAQYLYELTVPDRTVSAYADTAYGVLVSRGADDRGFALAYRALCTKLDIECLVVEGSRGSLGTEPHYWNIIRLDGDYYHVDVSALDRGVSSAFLLRDEDIWGEYIWSAADYPACDGSLRYPAAPVVSEPPEAPAEPAETPAEPQETEKVSISS